MCRQRPSTASAARLRLGSRPFEIWSFDDFCAKFSFVHTILNEADACAARPCITNQRKVTRSIRATSLFRAGDFDILPWAPNQIRRGKSKSNAAIQLSQSEPPPPPNTTGVQQISQLFKSNEHCRTGLSGILQLGVCRCISKKLEAEN